MVWDKQKLKRLPLLKDRLLDGSITMLKRIRKIMTSIIMWLVGFLFIGLGLWIILLRTEAFLDKYWPHNMLIGQMTVDGQENKGYAELLRARFDYHFRRPVAVPIETGFLEVLTLDAPELFQRSEIQDDLRDMNIEVGGVDVGYLVQISNKILKPERWTIEGDFQIKPDRALLAMRMLRGRRLIRTWYLERLGNTEKEKSILLEQLIDDAIFQLAYDFANKEDENDDIAKWRELLPIPEGFPSPEAVAAYFEARAALGRYYSQDCWTSLDLATERLEFLRRQMPDFKEGLQMLAIAQAERRNERAAIHVYEQLLQLLPTTTNDPEEERSRYAIQLLKAIATTNLYNPASAHTAISELKHLHTIFDAKTKQYENTNKLSKDQLAYIEMKGHAAIQIAYTYALYLSYIRKHQIAKMFGVEDAPDDLRIKSKKDLDILNDPNYHDPELAKNMVIKTIKKTADIHQQWIEIAQKCKKIFDQHGECMDGGQRRKKELTARLNLARGYAYFQMAEIENNQAEKNKTIFKITYENLLSKATNRLLVAESQHINHYQVLQLLGQVYSEPRRGDGNPSMAEQYFERAIDANPSDYWGYVLLANLTYRRILNTGLDLETRTAIQRGLDLSRAAVERKETSGSAQLIKAKFLAAMLEIERDETIRKEIELKLYKSIEQAARFLPLVFGHEDVDLVWLRLIVSHRKLSEKAKAIGNIQSDAKRRELSDQINESQKDLTDQLRNLIISCEKIEKRWIAQQRVFHVHHLKQKALQLEHDMKTVPLNDWHTIHPDLI